MNTYKIYTSTHVGNYPAGTYLGTFITEWNLENTNLFIQRGSAAVAILQETTDVQEDSQTKEI